MPRLNVGPGDGVLCQDLTFYGPDRLHSRHSLTAREVETQRDREHFKRVLALSLSL